MAKSFAELMQSLTKGKADYSKLFSKRLDDGRLSVQDLKKIKKKTGFSDTQINKLANKFQIEKQYTPMGPATPKGYVYPEGQLKPSPIKFEIDYTTGGLKTVKNPDYTPEPTPEPTLEPTPEPTPDPTPPPYVPEEGFDADALMADLNDALAGIRGDTAGIVGDLSASFGGQIEGLTSSFNTTISGLQDSINNQASAYESRIGGLQDQLLANQNTLNTYANQISDLGDQLREAQEKARQVKVTDTTYIGDNNASGVRLNRSNNYNRGAFALGTSQLNRDNMKNLFKINTVNL